jgi:hypothetical protein
VGQTEPSDSLQLGLTGQPAASGDTGAAEATRDEPVPARHGVKDRIDAAKHWAGYAWFMSFGTLLPLFVFLGSYLVHVTVIGAPITKRLYGCGIWLATFGQEPPGKDNLPSREAKPDRKPLAYPRQA